MQDKKDYALYDELDNLILIGRIGDIANYLNRSKRSIQLSISQYKKKTLSVKTRLRVTKV